MEKIPTAEERFREFFNSFPRYGTYLAENWKKEILKIADELAIDKAKFYVKAALEAAADKVELTEFAAEFLQEGASNSINKDSILNAYPENLIQ